MNAHQQSGCWYIDVRPDNAPEQISFDMTQHIPRRLAVGQSLVITPEPRKLLPVIRKRWMVLFAMVERQHACTLDPFKKQGLRWEMDHMKVARFTRQTPAEDPSASVYFLEPDSLDAPLAQFKTMYIVCSLKKEVFAAAVNHLLSGGLVVIYGRWNSDYEAVMHDLVRSVAKK
jgi:hypothetical protein